jgi:steroid 5-alpha reductase family enzyme
MSLLVLFGWLLLAVILYAIGWFIFSLAVGRSDVIDSAWGLGFVLVAWLALVLSHNYRAISIITAIFVSMWGVRLFWHITKRNFKKSEDHRYAEMRKKYGKSWKRKMFVNVYLTQAILLLLISTSSIAAISSTMPHPHWPATIAGFAVWAIGIAYEATADFQLQHFIKYKKKGHGDIMQSGLWRYSRHPNYFGEITSWWGAAIVAFSMDRWWGVIGALAITLLITKFSGIPLLEKHYSGNKAYEKYKRHTSVLMPLPPKK